MSRRSRSDGSRFRVLGGVAIASVIFDCLFWLFAFLRHGNVAFTAQALGAWRRWNCGGAGAGFIVAALIGPA